MKFFKSSMNCFFSSVSFPVTRYSTDTPRAWAILEAEITSGRIDFAIHPWNVPKGMFSSAARLSCVLFRCLIKGFTLFQNVLASIDLISGKNNSKLNKKVLTINLNRSIIKHKSFSFEWF